MKFKTTLAALFLALSSLVVSAADVVIDLTHTNIGISPATNRIVWWQRTSPFVGNIIATNTDSIGSVTIYNQTAGTYQISVRTPPQAVTFYVSVSGDGTVQAGNSIVAPNAATLPASQVAWATSVSDARYLSITSNVSGGSQTPWTSDINAAYYRLTNVLSADFGGTLSAWKEGRVFYDTNTHTLCYYKDRTNVTVNISEEGHLRVANNTGSTITNGSAVKFSVQGNSSVPRVTLAQSTTNTTSMGFDCIGLATEDISNGSEGLITIWGTVHGINTDSWVLGSTIYLSTNAGAYTTNPPPAGYSKVVIGAVSRDGTSNGDIFVMPQQAIHSSDVSDFNLAVGSIVGASNYVTASVTNGLVGTNAVNSLIAASGAITNTTPIIIDNDWGLDFDNELSALPIYAFHEAGKIKLLATPSCFSSPTNLNSYGDSHAWQMDKMNTFYGFDVAVGDVRLNSPSGPLDVDSSGWPSHYSSVSLIPSALDVYRSILAGVNTNTPKVKIIFNGNVKNLIDLCNSTADTLSPLTGRQLITNSVSEIIVNDGWFDTSLSYSNKIDNGRFWINLVTNISILTSNLGVPMTFVGGETADWFGSFTLPTFANGTPLFDWVDAQSVTESNLRDPLASLYAIYGTNNGLWTYNYGSFIVGNANHAGHWTNNGGSQRYIVNVPARTNEIIYTITNIYASTHRLNVKPPVTYQKSTNAFSIGGMTVLSQTTMPRMTGNNSALVVSNKVIFLVTSTKTNVVSDGR